MNQEQIIYRKINLIFAGIFLSVFLYSGFFAYTGLSPVIPSFHKLITGEPSISTGLSRSFSAIMKLHFLEARMFNRYGPGLFAFFLLQFCMRLLLFRLVVGSYYSVKQILIVDLAISVSMFIVFFEPFIRNF